MGKLRSSFLSKAMTMHARLISTNYGICSRPRLIQSPIRFSKPNSTNLGPAFQKTPHTNRQSSSMRFALFTKNDTASDKKKGGGGIFGWASKTTPGCQLAPDSAPAGQELATFAGGCFWGLQLAFDRVHGVVNSTVGYIGGQDPEPTYESVCSGRTGHAEAVQVYYDPKEVKYSELLDCFFQHVDPTTRNRQGGDMGTQYRSAIYYSNNEQKQLAEERFKVVNEQLQQSLFRRVIGSKVVTELEPASDYYIAEKYHQKYLQKGGRFGSGQSAEKGCEDKIRCYG